MSAPELMIWALAIPSIGAVLILMSEGRPNQRETVTLLTAVSLFAVIASLVPTVYAGGRPDVSLFTMLPGLEIG